MVYMFMSPVKRVCHTHFLELYRIYISLQVLYKRPVGAAFCMVLRKAFSFQRFYVSILIAYGIIN